MIRIHKHKVRICALLALISLFSGCGVFVRNTYNYNQTNPLASRSEETRLSPYIGISPTRSEFHVPFIYMSWNYEAPYGITFKIQTEEKIPSELRIHSIKLSCDKGIILDETFSTPIGIPFAPTRVGNYFEVDYRYELNDSLEFEEGRHLELEVVWDIPGIIEKKKRRISVVGEKEKETYSLFSAYMSV